MLKRCNLNLSENPYGQVALNDVEALIKKTFANQDDAVLLVETTQYARLLPLKDATIADYLNICSRLVVSSILTELRIEAQGDSFAYRFLQESPGEAFVYRDDLLFLRKNRSIAPELFQGERGRMRNREYFQENADGMYIFVTDRLAGAGVGRN